jgi:hypothetical protein
MERIPIIPIAREELAEAVSSGPISSIADRSGDSLSSVAAALSARSSRPRRMAFCTPRYDVADTPSFVALCCIDGC